MRIGEIQPAANNLQQHPQQQHVGKQLQQNNTKADLKAVQQDFEMELNSCKSRLVEVKQAIEELHHEVTQAAMVQQAKTVD